VKFHVVCVKHVLMLLAFVRKGSQAVVSVSDSDKSVTRLVGWRSGSVVRRMNKVTVTLSQVSRPLGMGDHIPSQLGQLNRVPALVLLAGGKGGDVTSVIWLVPLCDPIWHVSSRSGEASCKLLYSITLLYCTF